MKIEIIDTSRGRRFLWANPSDMDPHKYRVLEYVAPALSAPYWCRYEKLEVRRGDEVVTSAIVRWIGTHASSPTFEFLKTFGGCRDTIKATEFEVGDKIVITPLSSRTPKASFEELYWMGMQHQHDKEADPYEETEPAKPTISV